jgi:demethylmenaquinone methyltransferase/2-methoxy-6-polyprenyl-1,4-benzoquinol methylase
MERVAPITEAGQPSDTQEVRRMFDRIAPTYDALNRVLSFGINWLWEGKLISLLPRDPDATFLDLCTGTGALVPRLSQRCGKVVAADISPQMLAVGKRRHKKIASCEWIEADAQSLPFSDESFDAVTIAYGIRNVPDRLKALKEALRVSKPGATLAILEFGQARNRLWGSVFGWYSRVVIPWVGGVISGERSAYEYLPKTSAVFPCGSRFEDVLRQAGWVPLSTRSVSGGVAFIYIARKTG